MNIRFRPAAERDLRGVRDHLHEVDPRLSTRFADAVDAVLQRLAAFPHSAPAIEGRPDVRRALLRGFPHALYYPVASEEIVVLRVLHTSRADGP